MKEDREIIPLRTILQNCLNHIENLETNRAICDNYEKEFQDLKQFSETLKIRKEFACTEGEKEVNRKKNRYKDILPFNVSRVILSEYAGIPGSDYINANFIKGASGSPAYIASQGPLPNTVNDFWRMVVECEVQVIVMACNAEEAGKHKCENYWVEKEGEEKRFGMVEICLVKASTVCPDFLVRTMRLKYTNDKAVTEERTVCQFHYSAWPDHGVPPLVRPLLDMVRLVRDTQASETLPVLVHCSAGCGRTGTICAIDFVWGLLRAGKLTEEFSLFNLVRDMRKQRVAMVQTKEQYILVHQAVRELFKEQLRVIESHPYENIDLNGVPLIKNLEEPVYDTIGPCKDNRQEKQDCHEAEKQEENKDVLLQSMSRGDTAPPLPRKKRPNVPCSKQEKEVENLTEKNRCSGVGKEQEICDVSPSNSLLSKPRIAKLKALFERSPTSRERNSKNQRNQTVSRSHSLGAIRKPLFTEEEKGKPGVTMQPIPDGGKLKVPKLSLTTATVMSRPVPLIKRSKSLKLVSQPTLRAVSKHIKPETLVRPKKPVPQVLKIPQTSQPSNDHSRRRRSLESLMGDEPLLITWPTSHLKRTESAAESLKQHFQQLTIEAQKKMNSLVSGIGVRERRNSFRQAISREDRNNYEHIWLDQSVHVDGLSNNFNEKLTVRSQNGDILQPQMGDQVDGSSRAGNIYERIDIVPNSNQYPQASSSFPRPKPQIMPSQTRFTPKQELRRTDSKNLFLQRLNMEIQEEQNQRERERKGLKPAARTWHVSPNDAPKPGANFLGVHAYKKSPSPFLKDVPQKSPMQIWSPRAEKINYATSYDLYATVNKKATTYSPCDPSHSDSDSPRLTKSEVASKQWPLENSRQDFGSESSSSSSVQELSSVMNSKPPEQSYNYGIVARVKLRQPRSGQTRDDFVLAEPVAPPRVKRHASVMVSRHSMIDTGSSQLSAWTVPNSKRVEGSGWNGTLGVDLDAIAASMQRQKGESAVVAEALQINKTSLTNASPPQQPFKKQQHYL